MKQTLMISAITATLMIMFSGCGDSVESIEEYEKLSKEKLDSMYEECSNKIDKYTTYPKRKEEIKTESDLKDALAFEAKAKEHERKIYDIEEEIYKARGERVSTFEKFVLGLGWYSQITDDELAKFGDSTCAEYVRCGRIAVAREGGFDNYVEIKNRARAERFKNVGKK